MIDQNDIQKAVTTGTHDMPHREDPGGLEYTARTLATSPDPGQPHPVDHIPHMWTGAGIHAFNAPLSPPSPLDDDADDEGDPGKGLRERADEALAYAQETLQRGAEAAGTLREAAAQYQPPIRETAHEAEVFTRNNPKVALALAFGAGVVVAKVLRKMP